MNFYKHHIGDYAAATAHLTFIEDAAYTRLLRIYYRDEKALPADIRAVQRLAGARTEPEQDAVATVLREFFRLESDGWHNKRCDEEIGKAQTQAETNRRIAEEREARRRGTNEKRNVSRTEHDSYNGASNDSCNESLNESLCVREPSQTPDSRLQDKKQKQELPNGNSRASAEADAPPAKDSIPYRQIVDCYNATLTGLAKVRELTPKRRTLIRSAWQASKHRRSLAFWQAYFAECQDDQFLNGGGPYGRGHENWQPSFDYLLRADVVTRTFERAMDRMERAA